MKSMSTCAVAAALALLPLLSHAAPMPAGWTSDLHSSASITFVADDALSITAHNNVHAHVEKDLQQKVPFRVSAAIKSPEVADWAPSLFLYWKPGVWLRTGYMSSHDIYHVHGPGVYGIISTDSDNPVEYRLTTTASSDWTYNTDNGGLDKAPVDTLWQRMAMVLTDDAIHFQVSDDGKNWSTVRTVERPAEMQGSPAKLIVGKGYYEPGTYPAADMDNDYPDAGPMVQVQIKDLAVTPVSDAELKMASAPGEHFQDVYGKAELAKPGDPTFESVASHWPPLLYPRDALGVANHPEEFAVLPNGVIGCWPSHLLYPKNHDVRRAWFTVGADKHRFGGETTVTRSLLNGWQPVLTCGYRHDGLLYEQTMAGWSRGMSEDEPLIGLLQMKVSNPTTAPATTRLGFFAEHDKKELNAWENISIPAGGEHSVWLEIPFPNGSDQPLTAHVVDEAAYNSKIAEISSTWESLISNQMQIIVPEQRVNNAWRAWLVWMLIDVDKVKGNYEFHDGGAGFYELVYGFSASQAAQMADTINRPEDARRWIEAMLAMGNDDGLFIINFGLPDQGALLNAVAHHYRYTRDAEWLKKVAPTLVKMSTWARDARKTAKAETPTTSPAYGMIKMRPYCDHPDPGFYLVSDILLATGMQKTAQLLREIGLSQDAEWIAAEATEYATDLRRIIENSIFTVDRHELLPLFPETKELLRATGWMASDYYSLCITSLLESGGDILPANSRFAKIIVDALENRGGLLMGVSRFWGGIDHAYAAGYWYDRLTKGEPEKAILGLYSSMAYGMSQDTFSAVEVTFAKDGKNFPTLPHNYSNLQQIRLLKNLLVLEQGDTLQLGTGIARHWLAPGQQVEVTDAGTPWGQVSYQMAADVNANSIKVRITPPKTAPPGGIKVFFRHPESKPINTISAEGATVVQKGNDHVVLNNITGEIQLVANF